jgi:hypothetical protein
LIGYKDSRLDLSACFKTITWLQRYLCHLTHGWWVETIISCGLPMMLYNSREIIAQFLTEVTGYISNAAWPFLNKNLYIHVYKKINKTYIDTYTHTHRKRNKLKWHEYVQNIKMKKIASLAIKKTLKRKKKWTKKLSPSLQASDTQKKIFIQVLTVMKPNVSLFIYN